MKTIEHIPKMKTLLILLAITFTTTNAQNTSCLVDRCAACPDTTSLTCTACISGYYLRTISGGEKQYNDCWSTAKMVLALIGLLLLMYLCIGLCYLYYRLGIRNYFGLKKSAPSYNPSTPVVTQQSQAPVALKPVPIQRPVYISPRTSQPRFVSPRASVIRSAY